VKRKKRVDATLIILLTFVAVALTVALLRDPALVPRGMAASGRLFSAVWIELALGFLLAGLVEVVVPQEALVRWLGGDHPGRGILVGWAAGLVLPGGPYVFFPVAANVFRNGAAAGPIIALLTAKTLVSPIRTLTYEGPLLGWPLTLARFIPAMLLPPLLGLVGQWLFRFFKN
jgi:uncharacterized membrane protein YraQ (UPF0718 family)